VRIHQHLARSVIKVEWHSMGVGLGVRPVAAILVLNPVFNINLIEEARRPGHRTHGQLLALGFAMDLDKTHGDAADGHPGRVGQDAIFAKDVKTFEEKKETRPAPQDEHKARI
jgi:hypothetical protein